ncbi:hypothetical protein TrLO_g15815 [Triparma laevis f. longispina]|uniref:Uncharacterized protein n=1 Tax=Triparma laevis f. longispina TaxID=1714387 RepID=A0A9W6ZKC3_9STRA|nr:hypothetical protein TrLO_g15815 [Triparma laevis f. longispina]
MSSSAPVYELSSDSTSFDISSLPPAPVHLDFKDVGNKLFAEKKFEEAIKQYTQAYTSAPMSDDVFKSVVLSNRSICHSKLSDIEAAISDTRLSLKYDVSNVKTYIKLANYLHTSNQFSAAKLECEKGLKLDPTSSALLNAKKKIKLSLKTQPSKIDKTNKDYVSIYPDRTQKNGSSLELLRQLKFELGSGKANKTHTGLKGMFSRLLDAKLFQATVFPGLSEEARKTAPRTLMELLEDPVYEEEMASKGIPDAKAKAHIVFESVKKKGAKENQFMDAQTEANLWPQIMQEAIAHQVVAVVNRVHKRRAASGGVSSAVICAVGCAIDLNEIHGGEGLTIPINEKFKPMVDEILGEGNKVSGGKGGGEDSEEGMLVEEGVAGLIIVPGLEEERMSEIKKRRSLKVEGEEGEEGLEIGSGWFVLDDFLGEVALEQIGSAMSKDCKRMVKDGRLSEIPVMRKSRGSAGSGVMANDCGSIAWINGDELKSNYAALAEIIDCMKKLPSELNEHALSLYREHFSEDEVQVCKVAKSNRQSSVAVVSLEKGDKQPARIDSGEGTDGDVGHAVSCLYFVGDVESADQFPAVENSVNRSGALRLQNVSDNTSNLIEVKKDRLVCWRSKDVENERLEVLGENENIFVIQLWLHGCITSRENIMESIGRLKDVNIKMEKKYNK